MYELSIVDGKLRVMMGHTKSGDRIILTIPASRVYMAASRLVGRQEVELNIRCPKGSMQYEVESKERPKEAEDELAEPTISVEAHGRS